LSLSNKVNFFPSKAKSTVIMNSILFICLAFFSVLYGLPIDSKMDKRSPPVEHYRYPPPLVIHQYPPQQRTSFVHSFDHIQVPQQAPHQVIQIKEAPRPESMSRPSTQGGEHQQPQRKGDDSCPSCDCSGLAGALFLLCQSLG
jgi:hypothetical protein